MMPIYDVKITPYALSQMTEIRDYIAYQLMNPQAARNLIQQIYKDILQLKEMPKKFKTIDDEPWGSRGVRKLIIKNFYAYYWVDDETTSVHIIAVTYAMRDQMNVLKMVDETE